MLRAVATFQQRASAFGEQPDENVTSGVIRLLANGEDGYPADSHHGPAAGATGVPPGALPR